MLSLTPYLPGQSSPSTGSVAQHSSPSAGALTEKPRNQSRHILSRNDIPSLKPAEVLIFIAHPDDETLFAPGLIPYLQQHRKSFQVVYATIGDGGWNRLTNTRDAASMPAIRKAELTDAFDKYHSPRPPLVLDYKDGKVKGAIPAVEKDVLAVLSRLNPKEVYTFGPGGMSNHPDHKAVGKAVRETVLKERPDVRLTEFIHTRAFLTQLQASLASRGESDMLNKVAQWWTPYAASQNVRFKNITEQEKAVSSAILQTSYRTQFTPGETHAFSEAWSATKSPAFRDVPT